MSDDCNAVLIPDFETLTDKSALAVHFLAIIDEETYESLKQGGGASAQVPIKGIPVDFGANYEQFKENRRKFFESNQYSMNLAQSLETVRSKVSPEAIRAWLECKRIREPFRVELKSSSTTAATFEFVWNPPAHVAALPVTSSAISNGTAMGTHAAAGEVFEVGFEFATGAQITVIVLRDDPAGEIAVAVTIGNGYTASCTAAPEGTRIKLMRAAIDGGDVKDMALLLDKGFDVDLVLDAEMNRPLHLAAERGYPKIIKLLLDRGATNPVKNQWGDTPYTIAKARHGDTIAGPLK